MTDNKNLSALDTQNVHALNVFRHLNDAAECMTSGSFEMFELVAIKRQLIALATATSEVIVEAQRFYAAQSGDVLGTAATRDVPELQEGVKMDELFSEPVLSGHAMLDRFSEECGHLFAVAKVLGYDEHDSHDAVGCVIIRADLAEGHVDVSFPETQTPDQVDWDSVRASLCPMAATDTPH